MISYVPSQWVPFTVNSSSQLQLGDPFCLAQFESVWEEERVKHFLFSKYKD